MSIFYGLFVAYVLATLYIGLAYGDDVQADVDAKINAKQSLDEISKEVNDMRADFMRRTEQGLDAIGDGDASSNISQRAAMGYIEKIQKIAEILETVVLPTIVDSQNAQRPAPSKAIVGGSASVSTDPIKILPNRLKILQHHNSIGTPADDGNPLD